MVKFRRKKIDALKILLKSYNIHPSPMIHLCHSHFLRFDVATLAENKCLVSHYLAPVDAPVDQAAGAGALVPGQEYRKIVELEPGTAYKVGALSFF